MDVETERVERTVMRSPKDKILVDSCDEEENTNAYLNNGKWPAGLRDDVTDVGNTVSADSSEQQALKVEVVESSESVLSHESTVSSEIYVPTTSKTPSKDGQLSAGVVRAHETSASSELPNDEEMSADVVRAHETSASANLPASSELPKDDEISADVVETHDTSASSTALASPQKPNETHTASKSLQKEDETACNVMSKNATHFSPELHNTTETLNTKAENFTEVLPTHEVMQELSNVSEVENVCKDAHSIDQESLQPMLDKLDDIKEPEEPHHATECQLLHDNEETTETTSGKDGNATVGKNDDNGWIYVLGHDKLKKRVIKKGLENSRPVRGQLVTVNCVGHLEDGTEIDKHENWSLILGEDDFIQAFDLCVALMEKGETCEVSADSRFAYGELGRTPDIPPNATISYIIELIDYHDKREYSTMTAAERIQLSNEKRERGNYLYSRNEFSRSVDSYTKALKALDEDFESRGELPEALQELMDTRIKCHNNMAAAQMKVGAWDAASKSCDMVLKVQPENVKALFRKGKCLANKSDVSAAIPLLKQALKLEPETKIIHQELSRLERKNKAQTETEKALYQKMLGTDKEPAAKKKKENTSKWLWYVAGGVAAVLVSLGLTAYRYIHV